MTYTSQNNYGFQFTPKPLRNLIAFIVCITIFCALIDPLFMHFFKYSLIQNILGLSWEGIRSFFLWQPLTYLFVQNDSQGITLSFLFTLLFNMYILWVVGGFLIERFGSRSFFTLYFVSGILAGIISVLFMGLFGSYNMLTGPSSSLLAIFVVWAMLYPETEIMLFFIIPVKIKWLLAGIIAVMVLTNVSQLDFFSFIHYASSLLIGYLYGFFVWDLRGPFAWTQKLDGLLEKIQIPFSSKSNVTETKIYDLSSGQPLTDDDTFLDSMLSKISEKGENSLTWSERERMKKISDKKKRP